MYAKASARGGDNEKEPGGLEAGVADTNVMPALTFTFAVGMIKEPVEPRKFIR
jgi:hypothetical protein